MADCPECVRKDDDARYLESCRKSRQITEINTRLKWQNEYGVLGKLKEKTFDNFKSALNIKAYNVVKNYNGKSILFLSPGIYGIGKTHLVCALANHIVNTYPTVNAVNDYQFTVNPCPVFFTTESELLDRIRKTFNKASDGETEDKIYSDLNSVGLLIIDDVGKIQPKDYSFLQSVYYRILDTRWINDRPVIFTTNLDFDHLEQHLGGASADRLRGLCGDNVIKMAGKSQR